MSFAWELLYLQSLCYVEVWNRHFTALPILRDVFREKHSKFQWRTNIWFLFHNNAPAHQSVLVKDFLAKSIWQHWSILHTLLPWLQLILTCSLNWNQHWRNIPFVIPLTSLRMQRRSWKGFHKTASRNVSSIFTVHSYTRRLLWRKCSLNDCTVLYYSELKWFWEHFDAATYKAF